MTKLLRKYIHHLHVLNKLCKTCDRKKFIENCPKEFIDCLGEACQNLLKGNIPINTCNKKKLIPYRKALRFLASKKNNIADRKGKIYQRGGGFLPILLPPLIAIAAELIPNLLK